ncbi:MAG TPA: hypothetical protein VKY89_21030 [Thermoanaerobaculia bacterium]|nr:hypothetical protein [Thermoanaerobaculia bacterium]
MAAFLAAASGHLAAGAGGSAGSGVAAGPAAAAPAVAAAPAGGVAARFAAVPGPLAVEAMDLEWLDRDRNRQVPVRIYFPKRDPGPFPVVVFSSGFGTGRASLEFLGRHLASRGYVSVHVQHPGSDRARLGAGANRREAMLEVVRDPQIGLTRLLDLVFTLDQVGALAASSPVLRGRIDLKAIAVGGRDLGAWTALAAAGLAHAGRNGEESSLPDPRVKAALMFGALSAVGPQRDKLRFENVKVPCLHVISAPAAGEADALAAARRLAFDQISGADQVLVALGAAPQAPGGNAAGATATAPAARANRAGAAATTAAATTAVAAGGQRDLELQDRLETIVTAFLDAYLRHDAAAKAWLTGGGLATALGDRCRVETRSR